MLLLVAVPPSQASVASRSPAAPSCAEGATMIGETIFGTPCDDVIIASPDVATVKGGGGDDTIFAAPIADTSSCPDECRLGVGGQTFDGGAGDDVVHGERGNDTLNGGDGNDHLFGGIGDDLLRGGPGNDQISGGFGADGIDGDAGDDYIRGDGTVDTIVDSGGGTDTLSYATGVTPGFSNSAGYPNFSSYAGFPPPGGERGVYLDLGGGVGDNGVSPFGGGVDSVQGADFEKVIGTPFSDYIVGSSNGETIYGGGGGDVILGNGGDDNLHGGADGDDLAGGAGNNTLDGGAGADHCQSPASGGSCEPANTGGVILRDPAKISVGFMAPEDPSYSQLYLTGSGGADPVTATYAPGPPATVTFALRSGSTAAFDQSPGADSGCVSSAVQVVCTLGPPLDSLVLAGVGGADTLTATDFPSSVSAVIAGGEGSDALTGGELSEDVLADGPDSSGPGADVLSALGRDDALLGNGGADQLLGGDGNDLFLSNSICDGDLLNGGLGRDNASWAKFTSGVEARLDEGRVGAPGSGVEPQCAAGSFGTLAEIEDLEGSNSADVLYGDLGPNQLLGHGGPDTYFSEAGADTILANSADFDPTIDCGDDLDTAVIDLPQFGGEVAAPNCESVLGQAPGNFGTPPEIPAVVLPPPGPTQSTPPPPAVDTTAPRTRILVHPHGRSTTKKRWFKVTFRFASSETDGRFRCRLDGKPYRGCISPRSYLVRPGTHTVRIVAIDSAGNVDQTPALFRFTVRQVRSGESIFASRER